MRKSTIFPVMALSALTLGTITTTLPAGASAQQSVRFGEDDNAGDGTTQPTVVAGDGSTTPVGGAATGGGGTAGSPTSNPNVLLWFAAGGAGLALIGTGAVARRRRTLEHAWATTSSPTSTNDV
jgi:hypothetical protein